MGLDMYLTKKLCFNTNHSVEKKISISKLNNKLKLLSSSDNDVIINLNKLKSFEFDVYYGRKENHIHSWFVENVQDGYDDCREYWVLKKHLIELLNVCKEVINDKSKASKLLPTKQGFFFGSTEYDEFYFDSIERLIKILEEELKNENLDSYEYYYSSSW